MIPSLIQSESGGNWQAQNNIPGAGGVPGHYGRLQFGNARLQDAMAAGVLPQGTTPDQFMANPALQMAVEEWHFQDIDRRAQDMGLTQYIGQTVGGAQITQDAIRAMAHLGGIGGAARFLESGGQYNPSDAFGTSLLDYATQHGTGSPVASAQGQQPMGLLSPTMSTMNTPEPRRPSIWDRLEGKPIIGGLADPERRARLSIGLAGLSTRPNQGLIETQQGKLDDIAEERRVNQTVQWLQSIGRTDLAEAVAAGSLMGDQAAAIAMQPEPEGPAPIEINGQLVDPTTGAVIGDYRSPEAAGARDTAQDQNGILRYTDTGEPVFPDVQTAMEPAEAPDPTDLREEWNALPGVRAFEQRSASYRNILASAENPSAAGDVALIYNFMKMLDPGSTVMQGEVNMAQQAGGLDDQIRAAYSAALSGQALTEEQRKDFMTRATQIYQQQEQGYNQLRAQYENTAKTAGFDPSATLTEFRVSPSGQVLPGATNTPRATPNAGQQAAAAQPAAPAAPAGPAGQAGAVPPVAPSYAQNETIKALADTLGVTVEDLWAQLSAEDRASWPN